MSFSCFSKEVQDYTRACEHLIGESVRRTNQLHHFSEEELQLVNYYAAEVARLVKASIRRKHDELTGRISGTVK